MAGVYAHGKIYDLDLNTIDVESYYRGIVITESVNAHVRNIYIERCLVGVKIDSLNKNYGNVTIEGGVIAVPSSSAYGIIINPSKDTFINILGVHFDMPENIKNGIYIESNHYGSINIIGINPQFIQGFPYSTPQLVNLLSDTTFRNKVNYSNHVSILNNRKQDLVKILLLDTKNHTSGLIRIHCNHYYSEKIYHFNSQEFYYSSNIAGGMSIHKIGNPIIKHSDSYNYNTAFNVTLQYLQSDTTILVSLESKVIGGLQSDGKSTVSYFIEIIPEDINQAIIVPINDETGTEIIPVIEYNHLTVGTSKERPLLSEKSIGYQYFDTDLGKPIYAKVISDTEVVWVDANGSSV